MSIKLFVFDWDGTALGGHDPYDRFPKEFARFLDKLSGRGIAWATNTTWPVDSQYKIIKASGVKSNPAFLAGSTGLTIGRVVKNKLTTDAIYERKIRLLSRRFFQKREADLRRIASLLVQNGMAAQLAFNQSGHHYLWLIFADKAKARQGWRLADSLLKNGDMYRMSETDTSDAILPAHMNKGAPLEYMQKVLGLRAEDTMVAGDGWNDRHMFSPRLARWMVCPSNAHPGIKALVREHGGIIAKHRYSWGIIAAAEKIFYSSGSSSSS